MSIGCSVLKKSSKLKSTRFTSSDEDSMQTQLSKSKKKQQHQHVRENGNISKPLHPVQPNMRGGLRVYKIVILGDGGVGKSEDSYQQQAVIDNEAALLDILDTAGQVEFTAMRDQYMRCGEGFIICYSVTDRHSFQEASEYRKLITRVRLSEDIPLVLIANKVDLESQRRVTTEEGKNLANQFGCPFFETSAALRHYIDEAFYTLVREIRNKEIQKSNDTNSEKLHSRHRRSRWWRIRSIFALVFRRKRNLN
ncbi:GTP-binding protein Rit2 isoform X2 [Drosophila willistoni]|uniref:GTP-binding protein Rit2 isoform X2 n=1 Tax=Drosophila willistoni TaxID=7260 RepID=UPI001F07A678|nr:GTP-binding protein Rit2 isoform X2 [Drosophila willistoni]